MDPFWKALWVERLRSGKYRQTREKLASPKVKACCCLGVLCDVVDPMGWGAVVIQDTGNGRTRARTHRRASRVGVPGWGSEKSLCSLV
jgi:hypothetical protein